MFDDKITVSYSAEILKLSHSDRNVLKRTIALYLDAVHFICNTILENKDAILNFDKMVDKFNFVDKLVHGTSKRNAEYPEFDNKFPYMPCYLRRAAIAEAIGHMSSYFSNLKNYETERYKKISNGKRFKKKAPTLNLSPNKMPTFYKDNVYIPKDDNNIQLKLFNGKTWEYYSIPLKNTDCKYLTNLQGKRLNPSLEFRNNKFYVRYPFQQPHKLCVIKPVDNRVILSVDLGVNTHAACSVMKSDGTIIARRFITDATDKTTLDFLLNKKRELQKSSGRWDYAPLTHIQHKINCVNTAIENYTCHEIISMAQEFDVDVIVFEHLSQFKGRSSEKVHYWRKKAIIKKVCHKAHYIGIRYATINPRFTSMLAFDGSGFVKRGKDGGFKTNTLCMFKGGKIYNCDLNASYNIGARYFYREFKKENSELAKSSCNVTLSDLWKLNAVSQKAA